MISVYALKRNYLSFIGLSVSDIYVGVEGCLAWMYVAWWISVTAGEKAEAKYRKIRWCHRKVYVTNDTVKVMMAFLTVL